MEVTIENFLKKIQMTGSLQRQNTNAIDFPLSSNVQHLWQRLSPLGHISNPTAFLPYRRRSIDLSSVRLVFNSKPMGVHTVTLLSPWGLTNLCVRSEAPRSIEQQNAVERAAGTRRFES